MKISKLIESLKKCLEEYGDVDVVVNKYQYTYHYTPVTEVIPIFRQETLGITDPVVSKVEVY